MISTLCVTPAMEAGLTDHVWSIEEMCGLLPETSSAAKRIDRGIILKRLEKRGANMTRWEYKAIYESHGTDKLVQTLNELGQQGWEIAAGGPDLETCGSIWHLVLKRPM
jgi:hypothetical protein